jgi:hypothetical protein
MTAAADFVIASFDGRCVIIFSLRDSCRCAANRYRQCTTPAGRIRIGGLKRSTSRRPLHSRAINALPSHARPREGHRSECPCLQQGRRCGRPLSAKRPAARGLCLRASSRAPAGGTRQVSWWRQPRSAVRYPCCELRARIFSKRLRCARVQAHCSQPKSEHLLTEGVGDVPAWVTCAAPAATARMPIAGATTTIRRLVAVLSGFYRALHRHP